MPDTKAPSCITCVQKYCLKYSIYEMVENEEWKSHGNRSVVIRNWEFSGSVMRLPHSVLTIWHWEIGLKRRQVFPCCLCWEGVLKVLSLHDDARTIVKFLCITMHTYQTCFAVAQWNPVYDSVATGSLCPISASWSLQIYFSLFFFCSSEKIGIVTYYKEMLGD